MKKETEFVGSLYSSYIFPGDWIERVLCHRHDNDCMVPELEH
jgi:hypothetical protein